MANIVNIGLLIQNARIKNKLSSTRLCEGLCSVSMITRIENGERRPDPFLFEALMSRMNETYPDFFFPGTKRDVEISILKKQAMLCLEQYDTDTLTDIINRYEKIMDRKNKLELQYFQYLSARLHSDEPCFYELLLSAIKITIPNFDIANLQDYLLSTIESALVINMSKYYAKIKDYETEFKISKYFLYKAEQTPSLSSSSIDYFKKYYNYLISYIYNKDYEEVLHMTKKYFKTDFIPHSEDIRTRFLYQRGYSSLLLGQKESAESIIASILMNERMGYQQKAEFLISDAKNDCNFSFEIVFEL